MELGGSSDPLLNHKVLSALLIYPLSNNYFNLQIKLWDLRTAKCVKQYKGHHNEYAVLPLHVNEEEGLLTAGALTFFPSTCRVHGSDFCMPKECFLATAVGGCKAVSSLKLRRKLALDIL